MQLGDEVKDKVTGFKGVAYARSTYLTGCDHIMVQPKIKKDGTMPEAKWFDEPMIEVVKKNKVKMPAKTKLGGPMLNAPARNYSR